MHIRFALVSALTACGAWIASSQAADRDLANSRPQTAQVVTIARLAAVLCPGTEVDETAVHALMDQAGISDRDIVDPDVFGAPDTEVARSFARSFIADPKDACSTVSYAFGPGQGQLLRHAGKPI